MASSDWLEELRGILGADLHLRHYSNIEWRELAQRSTDIGNGTAYIQGTDRTLYRITDNGDTIECLEISRSEPMTEVEKKWIGFAVKHARPGRSRQTDALGTDKLAQELGYWINSQLESRSADPLPEALTLASGGRLYSEMIPILLVREYAGVSEDSDRELEKLLKSFFAEEVLLVPLQRNEWLLLSPLSLLSDSHDGNEEEETTEESLMSIGLGLHEMLSSEWIGECHLAVGLPVQPSKSIVANTAQLKETIELGRRFHMGSNLHLPWQLNLERLLSSIPQPKREQFIGITLSRSDYYIEPELLSTLETFFSLNCNVSETAKRLYIHRNTLLYRLDKLKQETGLDVRLFKDAVMMKLILLLDKVTKRP